jgi:hypothetical protein
MAGIRVVISEELVLLGSRELSWSWSWSLGQCGDVLQR